MPREQRLPRQMGTLVDRATLLIPGRVPGKARAKPTKRGKHASTYDPEINAINENAVTVAWMEAGFPSIGDGPVVLDLVTFEERPTNHYLVGGGLSAAGLRSLVPQRTPDWDNVGKLVCDALNGRAYVDDKQIADGRVRHRWNAGRGREEYAVLVLRRLLIEDVTV